MGGAEGNPDVRYPNVHNSSTSPFASAASDSLYPEIAPDGSQQSGSGNQQVGGTYEEHLVTVHGAMVHLVDDQQSVFLGNGDFSVIRINQENHGILALVRVGESLQWPLMNDEQVVKLDPIHYVFSLPVPPLMDHKAEKDVRTGPSSQQASGGNAGESMHYGVTFSVPGQEQALKELDGLLDYYTFFSSPTLVHGDKQKEVADTRAPNDAGEVDTRGAQVVAPAVVAGDGKEITEENQAEFWTTMAPNVNDYGNSLAKAIVSGTGQIIRGIFWIRDSTNAKLESGSIYMTSGSNPTDKPSNIGPRTIQNLQRVKAMSSATDNFAKSVLSGVIATVGFIPNAIARSKVGRKFFKTAPGEVALASLVSFWKLFDAVEQASRDMLQSGSTATQTVVTHKFGEPLGQATGETLGTAGHLMGIAWSVVKLPKALNPLQGAGLKPSKAAILEMQERDREKEKGKQQMTS